MGFFTAVNPDEALLEFGPIKDRDRIQIVATLKSNGQGAPLGPTALPADVLQSVGTSLDGRTVCREIFRVVEALFDGRVVKQLSRGAQIVGVMSDSLSVNGLATRLHILEDKHLLSVTAGTLLRGMVTVYRLVGHQAFTAGGPDYVLHATSSLQAEPFLMPRPLTAREFAMRCAAYGMLTIFCHELAHVMRGHTAFVSSKLQWEAIHEQGQGLSGDALSMKRLIEVDADEYAGKFLADILFSEQVRSKALFEDSEATKKFLQVVTGVLSLYLNFGREGGAYYSGPVRAHLVLSSCLLRCTNDPEAASWLRAQISEIEGDMTAAGVVSQADVAMNNQEQMNLVNVSLPARDAVQHEWVAVRPWQIPA